MLFGKRLIVSAIMMLGVATIGGITALIALGHLYYGIYVDAPIAIIAIWLLISLAV